MHAQPGDLVLIQGDFGATCLMVEYARSLGLTPIYATTARISEDKILPDGSVQTVRRFVHRRFRKYGV